MTQDGDRCQYCGAALDLDYYFCRSCATPYQEEERVLPRRYVRILTPGERIQQKAPAVARLFWTYFAVVVGTSVAVQILLGDDLPGVALFVFDLVLGVTTAFFVVAYGRSLVPQLKRIGFDHWEAWAALLMLLPLLLLNYGYHTWLTDLMGAGGESFFTKLREEGVSEAALLFSICVFPAVTEEIAFRGLVQHWLHVAVPAWTAIALAAALFAAMHFSVLSAPYLFLVGLLLGWARWRTGSLYPSMVIHFLHNFVVLEYFEL